MKLDNMKLYDEVIKKAYNDDIALSNAAERIGVSRIVFKNLREGKNLKSYTLIKIMTWLGVTDLKPFLTK